MIVRFCHPSDNFRLFSINRFPAGFGNILMANVVSLTGVTDVSTAKIKILLVSDAFVMQFSLVVRITLILSPVVTGVYLINDPEFPAIAIHE